MSKKGVVTFENKNITWFFFPIFGINIQPDKNWLKFIFQDATIANSKNIRNYLKIELSQNIHLSYILSEFKDDQSYIVVAIDKYFNKETEKLIIDKAHFRANTIAGLIYIIFLHFSYFKYAVTLAEEVFDSSGSTFNYLKANGSWGNYQKNTKGEFTIFLPESAFKFSRKAFIKFLNREPIKNLFKLICKNQKNYGFINQSIVNFYKLTNVPSATTQFVGAISSIELLIKDSEKYSNMENRLRILLNDRIFNEHIKKNSKYEGILNRRHKIVHDGSHCDKSEVFIAISIYINTLFSFSKIIKYLNSKDELCLYLDLIYKYTIDDRFNKNDTLKLLDNFHQRKLNIESNEWILRRLIRDFNVCNPNLTEIEKENYLKLVHYIHKIYNIDLLQSYEKCNNNIFYNTPPFINFNEFENEYNNIISNIISNYDQELIDKYSKI